MVDVRVLGALTISVDGAVLELPADARARELVAWLALHPGLHSRSRLAGLLRPDVAEEHARKTLRDAVYELRRMLPAAPGAR
jgi:DNA-binding SARP family transcriptional activator